MSPQYFTREEAEKLIPRLTALLSEIREHTREHDRLQNRVAELQLKTRSNGHDPATELQETRGELERTVGDLNKLIERVHSSGCEVKGIEEGLIDFRTEMDGREVYLCWKFGEVEIGWWHDLDTGFAGRQRLADRTGSSE